MRRFLYVVDGLMAAVVIFVLVVVVLAVCQ